MVLSKNVKRGVAAGGTVVVAAAVNVATGVLTQHWALAWWMAAAVLVAVGAALQFWLSLADRSAPAVSVVASGDGSVAGAGSMTNVSTNVDGSRNIEPLRVSSAPERSLGVATPNIGAVTGQASSTDGRTDEPGEELEKKR
jgi:hypothetical protein